MNIKTNGTYYLRPKIRGANASSSIVYVSGVSGTATITLSYIDETGATKTLEGGLVLTNTQNSVDHGIGMPVYVVIATADGTTDLNIEITHKQ